MKAIISFFITSTCDVHVKVTLPPELKSKLPSETEFRCLGYPLTNDWGYTTWKGVHTNHREKLYLSVDDFAAGLFKIAWELHEAGIEYTIGDFNDVG